VHSNPRRTATHTHPHTKLATFMQWTYHDNARGYFYNFTLPEMLEAESRRTQVRQQQQQQQQQHHSGGDDGSYGIVLSVHGQTSPPLLMVRRPIIVTPPSEDAAAIGSPHDIQPASTHHHNIHSHDDNNHPVNSENVTVEALGHFELSTDATVVRFRCRWYFLSDDGMYYPLSFQVCHRLDYLKWTGCPMGRDGERDYFIDKFLQRNRESRRSRPLLYLPTDALLNSDEDAGYEEHFGGTAVCGRVVPTWSFFQEFRGTSVFAPLDFTSSERLEEAFRRQPAVATATLSDGGIETVDLDLTPDFAGCDSYHQQQQFPTPVLAGRYRLTFNRRNAGTARAEHIATKTIRTLRRDFPSWLFLHDKGVWCPIDAGTATLMTMAVATGRKQLDVGERVFNFERYKQLNHLSRVERPLLRILSTISMAPEASLSDIQTWFPTSGISERLHLAVGAERTLADIIAALRSGNRVLQMLATIHLFVVRLGCVVKGGAVRDAVVLGDVKHCVDINVEVPIGANLVHSATSLKDDIKTNIMPVLRQVGLEVAGSRSAMMGSDRFGVYIDNGDGGGGGQFRAPDRLDALSGKRVEGGIFTLKLEGFFSVDVECVTHWNYAHHPPRNIDFSANNLRLVPKSLIAATAAVPYPSSPSPPSPTVGGATLAIYQSVPIGLSSADIIAQILKKQTCPVYGFVFLPKSSRRQEEPNNGGAAAAADEDTAEVFDAADGVSEVVVLAPTPAQRSVMLGRLRSMKEKGFHFVPLESVAMRFQMHH
jgi:hypothetical protein